MYPVDKKRINEFGFGGEEDQASTGAEAIAAKEEGKKTNWASF